VVTCPACGAAIEGGNEFVVCTSCGGLLVRTTAGLREVTAEERAALPPDLLGVLDVLGRVLALAQRLPR
jgi:hypothetical protein